MENWNKVSRSIAFNVAIKYEKSEVDLAAETSKETSEKSSERN
jgi:hypothetical protein